MNKWKTLRAYRYQGTFHASKGLQRYQENIEHNKPTIKLNCALSLLVREGQRYKVLRITTGNRRPAVTQYYRSHGLRAFRSCPTQVLTPT